VLKNKKSSKAAAPLRTFVSNLNPISLVAFVSARVFAVFVMPHDFRIFAVDYGGSGCVLP
jgi:hypothetical protein